MPTKKDYITIITIIAVLAVIYYLVSPLWNVKEVDEPLPSMQIDDNLFGMDLPTTEKFNEEMQKANATSPKVMNEGLGDGSLALLAQGTMTARAHNVQGTVAVIEVDGKKYLRFEDLDTVNGPNLHIYLATGLSDKEIVDLGPIRGTKGNINYALDTSVDISKYKYVLIWCVPFRVLFSYAELKQGFQTPERQAPELIPAN